MPVVIDWRQATTPDEVAQQALTALANGSTITLPSEIGPVLVAIPALLQASHRPNDVPESTAVERWDAYYDLAECNDFTSTDRLFAQRIWPGAIAWKRVGLPFPIWSPEHPALATVLAAHRGPLAVFSADRVVDTEFSVVDSSAVPKRMTVIRGEADRWAIATEGDYSSEQIAERLTRRILFICTGNTCRSPLAEAMFKSRLANILSCEIDQLPNRGYLVESAGVAASDGAPATLESVIAGRDLGVDLSLHRSRPATVELVARADDLIAVTRGHLLTVISRYPVITGAMRLLGGSAGDLDDPIGRGPDTYRACAEAVRSYVDRLITEMGLT